MSLYFTLRNCKKKTKAWKRLVGVYWTSGDLNLGCYVYCWTYKVKKFPQDHSTVGLVILPRVQNGPTPMFGPWLEDGVLLEFIRSETLLEATVTRDMLEPWSCELKSWPLPGLYYIKIVGNTFLKISSTALNDDTSRQTKLDYRSWEPFALICLSMAYIEILCVSAL